MSKIKYESLIASLSDITTSYEQHLDNSSSKDHTISLVAELMDYLSKTALQATNLSRFTPRATLTKFEIQEEIQKQKLALLNLK